MCKFKKIETGIEGLYIIEPKVYEDERGFFFESYNKEEFAKLGIEDEFIQDNHSKSQRGVIRGMHFQRKFPQGKLIRVIRGKIYDVALDIREGSKSYGKYFATELSEENRRMLYIPKGFAHGFLALQDGTEINYKNSDRYAPKYEDGISWDDPDLGIDWKLGEYGIDEVILSKKDGENKSFAEYGRRVLITGAKGQVGTEVTKLCQKRKIICFPTSKEDLNILDFAHVREFIIENRINTIVNCASYNNVDGAESERELCYAINSEAVRNLVSVASEFQIPLVTYSSDFVFDGEKGSPYLEEDARNPLSVYGKSKVLAENYAASYDKALVIRTSWVFSMENPNNFMNRVVEWSKTRDEIKLTTDQIGNPTSAEDIATITWKLLMKERYGVYNFCNSGTVSKFEQGKYMLSDWDGRLRMVKMEDFHLPAKRPKYSALDTGKIEKELNIQIAPWYKKV